MKTVTFEVNTFPKHYEMVVNTENYSPSDSEFHICRFCNESDSSKFKSIAHVIPEFTGNKKLVHYSECDNCNNKFSKYERDLSLFGGIKNIIAGIKGKKYPKHIDKKNNFFAKSTNKGFQIFEHKRSDAIKTGKDKVSITSDTQKFRPRFVQKALVKIALSMIDKDELYKFKKTIEWLSIPEDNLTTKEHPLFILIEREIQIPLKKPAVMLMKKKGLYNAPEYALLFYCGFFAYQLYIPFNEADKDLDYENFKYPLSTLVVADLDNLKEVKFNSYHMTELKRVKLTDHFERRVK